MVRFGLLNLFESTRGRSDADYFRDSLALCEHADRAGLDEVWFPEHHFGALGVMPSPQLLGAAVAARTERLRIGTAVTVLPLHHPLRLAEELAMLDHLSGGRLDVGVGRGSRPEELLGWGVPPRESLSRFQEGLAVLRQAWTRDEVRFAGEHYRFDGVTPRPRPLQGPHPPLFGASFSPHTIPHQAQQGLNLLFSPLTSPPEALAAYWQGLRDAGHDPGAFRAGGMVFVYVAETTEQAIAEFEQPAMRFFRSMVSRVPRPGEQGPKVGVGLAAFFAGWLSGAVSFRFAVERGPFRRAFLVGDPPTVRRKVVALLDAYPGLTDVLCWTRVGGIAQDKVLRSISLLTSEVVPPLREAA